MKKIDLSIIIASYNTASITQNCIKSIYDSFIPQKHYPPANLEFEVIVVDNNSSDNSVEIIKKLQKDHPNLILIPNKENVGFGKANNQGVDKAKGDYILLLNSDIVVLQNSIEKLYYFYTQNEKEINFLGGKLLNKDGTPQPSCGPFFSLPVLFGFLFLKGDTWNLTRQSPSMIKETDWVSGACILTKKEYFLKTGTFDEGIFMYMEEVDLLYRAKKRGYSVFFYPDAQFTHLGSSSSGGRSFPIIQAYRGFIYFYKKHHSKLALFLLKIMLKLKAIVGVAIGRLIRSKYLTTTYEEAYKMARMD